MQGAALRLAFMSPPADKRAIRRQVRAARASLFPHQRRRAAAALARRAARTAFTRRAQRIGIYFPLGEEMDVVPLINRLLSRGKQCFLPVLAHGRNRRLSFAPLNVAGEWYKNRYGIPEQNAWRHLRAMSLDILFIPLVAFDANGNRLGMGAGFYDATLSYLRLRKRWRKPRLVGVGYDFQRVRAVPADDWDLRLDTAVTDKAIYRFKTRG